jgi:hypothetical protein
VSNNAVKAGKAERDEHTREADHDACLGVERIETTLLGGELVSDFLAK